jgi:hypothetical protein
MKKVDNATGDVGYGGGWFKISEEGFNPTSTANIFPPYLVSKLISIANTWAVTNLVFIR